MTQKEAYLVESLFAHLHHLECSAAVLAVGAVVLDAVLVDELDVVHEVVAVVVDV